MWLSCAGLHAVEAVEMAKAKPVGAGQGRAGQGRAGQGRAGQDRAGQGRAGQGRAGQGLSSHGALITMSTTTWTGKGYLATLKQLP